MNVWLLTSILGLILVVPVHFLSVEHLKLEEKYGRKKGARIGEICGLVSGWGFFFFWIGIWISPQPRFSIPIPQNPSVLLPIFDFEIPLLHLVVCLIFLVPGAWLAVEGLKETSLKVAETHRAERIVSTGVYMNVRHPQYLGGLLAHVGISFLLSAWHSFLLTPLMIALIYLISAKEEEELIREFREEYEDYRRVVPMLVPKLRKKRMKSARYSRRDEA